MASVLAMLAAIVGPVAAPAMAEPQSTVQSALSVTITIVSTPTGPGKPGTFRFDSTAAEVVKFRYGLSEPIKDVDVTPVEGGGTTATVTIVVPGAGINQLFARAIDADDHLGPIAVAEFRVPRPAPAIASWALETSPGLSQAGALMDQRPAPSDTPLIGTNLTWASDARLIEAATARFGADSEAVASGLTLDTTTSFSVAAWVSVRHTGTSQTVVSQDGGPGQWSSFRLGTRRDSAGVPHWCFTMSTTPTDGNGQSLCSPAIAVVGRWTHLVASFDLPEGKMRLWVDGVSSDVAFATPVTTTGPIVFGRAMNGGLPAERLHGDVAAAYVYDRPLTDPDVHGVPADEPESGGFEEAGLFSTTTAGRWGFENAIPCYQEPVDTFCQAPDLSTWGRSLVLAPGVQTWDDRGGRSGVLHLDNLHWVEDPDDPLYGTETREYGLSGLDTSPPGQPEQWQYTPVLRTDQSYTVSVWVRPDLISGRTMTAVSQQGSKQSAFYLGMRDQRWSFSTTSVDGEAACAVWATASMTSRALSEEDSAVWTHLLGVYDMSRGRINLYVNGVLEGSVTRPRGYQSNGPLTVGAARFTAAGGQSAIVEDWYGAIDELSVHQGAMTEAQVRILHDSEASE